MTSLLLTPDRLLWRTAGVHWEYMFLCIPKFLDRDGWLDIHEKVFADVNLSLFPRLIRGNLRLSSFRADGASQSYPFVAAAFLDPYRRDFTERPIKHYFIYFLEEEQSAAGFRYGWPEALLQNLTPALTAIFAEDPHAPDARQAAGSAQRARRERVNALLPAKLTINASGGGADWRDCGQIDHLPATRSRIRGIPHILAAVVATVLLAASVAGVLIAGTQSPAPPIHSDAAHLSHRDAFSNAHPDAADFGGGDH